MELNHDGAKLVSRRKVEFDAVNWRINRYVRALEDRSIHTCLTLTNDNFDKSFFSENESDNPLLFNKQNFNRISEEG
jgi:hypothetical protein